MRSGPVRPTYSGRGIEAGTARIGVTVPLVRVPRGARSASIVVFDMGQVYGPGPRPSVACGAVHDRVAGGCPPRDREERTMAVQHEFYYNLATHEIEEGKVHGATNRMGPYPTAE